MALPRFQRMVQALRGQAAVNPSAGAAESSLESTLTNFANMQSRLSVQRGIETAALEGFETGVESDELQQASDFTLAGRAFNRSARVAHIASIRTDVKSRLGELAIDATQLPADQWLDAFVASSDGFRDGLLKEVDPAVRADVAAYFNETVSGQRLKVLDAQQSQLQKQVLIDLKVGQDNLLDDIDTAARELDGQLLTKRQREFEAMVTGAVDAGIVLESVGKEQIQQMHSLAISGEVLGAFDRVLEDEGIEAAEKSLSRFKRENASSLMLSAEEKDGIETAMLGMFNRERSILGQAEARRRAEIASRSAGLTKRLNDTTKMLDAGHPTDVTDLARDLINDGKFDQLGELQASLELQAKLSLMQEQPLALQQGIINDARSKRAAGKLTPTDSQFIDAAEKVMQRTDLLLDTDSRTLAIEQGFVDPELPLSFEPGEFSATLAARKPSADMAAEHYDADISVMTTAETDALGRIWETADIGRKLELTQEINDGLGTDAGDVLSQLDKKGFRVAAYAGGLQSEQLPGVAAAVLTGQEILKDTQLSKGLMPTGTERAGMEEHIAEVFGNTFQLLPQFRATTLEAIDAYYVNQASNRGDHTGEWKREHVDDAISAVAGNILNDRTGGQVLIRDIEQSQFDAWINSIDASMIEAAGGVSGFEAEQAATIISSRARMISMGQGGRFRFVANDPFSAQPQALLNDDGSWFELQMDFANLPAPVITESARISEEGF